MMKKQFLIGLLSLITITVVGQKNELKAADKALKKGDLTAAKSSITQAEGLIANADDKLKAKFYFLKGKTYADISKKQPSLDKNAFDIATKSLNELFDFEEKINKKTFSSEAKGIFDGLLGDLRGIAVKQYNKKDYLLAANNFQKVYSISPVDTFLLDNAANSAHLAKDYKLALKFYLKLNELGYQGVTTEYKAKNVETDQMEVFSSKSHRDLMMKSGKYTNPEDKTSKSRSISIAKNVAYMYGKLGENEKGLIAIRKARESQPDDYNLLLAEADLQIKLGNRDAFGKLMAQAIEKNPNNPILYFNLGVISSEQKKNKEALKYYAKAIELDENYSDAYLNYATVLRRGESIIIDEMNKNMSDFDKYDELQAKLSKLYVSVLPYYEKVHEIKKDDISIIQILMGIYENLEMDSKYKAMKVIYDELRN